MLLNKKYKIEQFDKLNIAIFKRQGTNKDGTERWVAIGYFKTFEQAFRAAVDRALVGEITYAEDCEKVIQEIKAVYKYMDQLLERYRLQQPQKTLEGKKNGAA